MIRTRSDDGNVKLQDISHGQNHEMHSAYSGNCMSNLGNPHGMRPDNKCITRIQDKISSDTTFGEEAIGQHVKTIIKTFGISHIYSGGKCKGDSAHIQKDNLSQIRPDNEIISGIQENLSVNAWEEEAIGQYVKTDGKLKGISHLTRMTIVDLMPVQ